MWRRWRPQPTSARLLLLALAVRTCLTPSEQRLLEDAAAFLRSIADQRNRNADALQETVLKAESYTAEEAVSLRVVDLTAENVADLLAKLDGRSIEFNGQQIELDTAGLTVTTIERTPVERFIGFLANPNIAFLLLTVGGIGILIELFSPGLIGPGAVGVIALALAFLAFGNLPVNWVGVCLIILAMALFYLEAQAPGIGIFGVSGAVAFIIGAFLLFGNISFTSSGARPACRAQLHYQHVDNRRRHGGYVRFSAADAARAQAGEKDSSILRLCFQQPQ